MHWSKSRQVDYESCPRKFFYSEIAAPRNSEIRALADAQTPPLVRHEVVRTTVSGILRESGWQLKQLPRVIKGCQKHLESTLQDPQKAAAESSIVTACISGFAKDVLPDL